MEFPFIEKENNYVGKGNVFRISKSFDKLSYQSYFRLNQKEMENNDQNQSNTMHGAILGREHPMGDTNSSLICQFYVEIL